MPMIYVDLPTSVNIPHIGIFLTWFFQHIYIGREQGATKNGGVASFALYPIVKIEFLLFYEISS